MGFTIEEAKRSAFEAKIKVEVCERGGVRGERQEERVAFGQRDGVGRAGHEAAG